MRLRHLRIGVRAEQDSESDLAVVSCREPETSPTSKRRGGLAALFPEGPKRQEVVIDSVARGAVARAATGAVGQIRSSVFDSMTEAATGGQQLSSLHQGSASGDLQKRGASRGVGGVGRSLAVAGRNGVLLGGRGMMKLEVHREEVHDQGARREEAHDQEAHDGGGAREFEDVKMEGEGEGERVPAMAGLGWQQEGGSEVWRTVLDESSGDVYYWNVETGETQWEAPT